MKKLFILGGSELQIPVIKKAKEQKIFTIVADMNEHAEGRNYSDVFLPISTNDTSGILDAAKLYDIDGIISFASDNPLNTSAVVANELGLSSESPEVVKILTNKYLQRVEMKKHNLPYPDFYKVSNYQQFMDAISLMKGRKIIKPVDSSGSRGVFLLDENTDETELKLLFNKSKVHSKSNSLIIEEFLEGKEISVEAIVINRGLRIIAFTDKYKTPEPKFVEMGHSQPANISPENERLVFKLINDFVSSIDLKNTVLHVEIILTSKGPVIVEVGGRAGGDYIASHLTSLSTGINFTELAINIALGQDIKLNDYNSVKFNSCICYFNPPAGKLISISGLEIIEKDHYVIDYKLNLAIGDYIKEIHSSLDRVGFVIVQTPRNINAYEYCLNLIKKVVFEVE